MVGKRAREQTEIPEFYRETARKRANRTSAKNVRTAFTGQKEDKVNVIDEEWIPSEPQRQGLLDVLKKEAERETAKRPLTGISGRLNLRLNEAIQATPRSVVPRAQPVPTEPSKKAVEIRAEAAKTIKKPDRIQPLSRPPKTVVVPLTDPLAYDHTLLPAKYVRLLRAMDGLESANVFNRARRQSRMRFSEIESTVSNHAGNTFTENTLAVLVGAIPEAFRVSSTKNKEGQNDLEIELVDPVHNGDKKKAARLSPRRILLHKRLVALLHQTYNTFLESLTANERAKCSKVFPWHDDFDPESSEMPRAAILRNSSNEHPQAVVSRSVGRETSCTKSPWAVSCADASGSSITVSSVTSAEAPESRVAPEADAPEDNGWLPSSVLEKVRNRKRKAHERKDSGADEREQRHLLLSRLVTTIDAMRSVLGTRTRMDLNLLVTKLSHVHRERWSRDELLQHIQAISEEFPQRVSIDESKAGALARRDAEKTRAVFKLIAGTNFSLMRKEIQRKKQELLR